MSHSPEAPHRSTKRTHTTGNQLRDTRPIWCRTVVIQAVFFISPFSSLECFFRNIAVLVPFFGMKKAACDIGRLTALFIEFLQTIFLTERPRFRSPGGGIASGDRNRGWGPLLQASIVFVFPLPLKPAIKGSCGLIFCHHFAPCLFFFEIYLPISRPSSVNPVVPPGPSVTPLPGPALPTPGGPTDKDKAPVTTPNPATVPAIPKPARQGCLG